MKRLALLLAGVSLFGADPRQERGKRIVGEAVAVLGGDRFFAVRDRVESGRAYSFFREELSGLSVAKIYTRYLIKPEPQPVRWLGIRERQAFGKNETSSVLFTGDEGYQITFRGARPIPDDMLERFRLSTLSNVFYILRQRIAEPGLIFESQGSDVWANMPVEIVDITDAQNEVVTVYFHSSEKYPVRQIWNRRDPKTRERIEEESEFSKYRDVGGGVKWPFTMIRRRNGEKIYEIFSESVVINQGLSDNLFTLPANIKILGKPRS